MVIQDNQDLYGIMAIGKIVGETIQHMKNHLEPGMRTADLDEIGAAYLKKQGARSAPILAYKFPATTCISINDEAAHGIPGDYVIQPGDFVNIDVSAEKDGYWADSGFTVAMDPVTPEARKHITATQEALDLAINMVKHGVACNQIGRAVERFAHAQGFEVIEELGGHGLGRHIHEKPSIPNHYHRRNREKLSEGMVITIEPFLTTGARHIYTEDDGWTLKTTDGSRSVQFEHTLVVTQNQPIIVTQV